MLGFNDIKKAANEIGMIYPIKKISLFGSYADGTANENSDVDMLIEFLTPNVSLFTILTIKYEIEEKLHKGVDIIHAPIEKTSLINPLKVIDIYEQ